MGHGSFWFILCSFIVQKHDFCKEYRSLSVTSGEAGIEVNAEKTTYLFMSYQPYVGQNYSMKDS
jgi:hypothetical protein